MFFPLLLAMPTNEKRSLASMNTLFSKYASNDPSQCKTVSFENLDISDIKHLIGAMGELYNTKVMKAECSHILDVLWSKALTASPAKDYNEFIETVKAVDAFPKTTYNSYSFRIVEHAIVPRLNNNPFAPVTLQPSNSHNSPPDLLTGDPWP